MQWLDQETGEMLSEREIRARHDGRDGGSSTAIPSPMPQQFLRYHNVVTDPRPDVDQRMYSVVLMPPVHVGDGIYRRQWSVVERPLDEIKAAAKSRVGERRLRAETGGFVYAEKTIDSDRDSILRITSAATTAATMRSVGAEFSVEWTCADNTALALDAQGLAGMQVALAMHGHACHLRARALKDQIEAATSLAEIAQVLASLDDGWPAADTV
jgi:hypothetical protein